MSVCVSGLETGNETGLALQLQARVANQNSVRKERNEGEKERTIS